MDLEVVGRHALLFDDDATAAFTNSSDALVEWNGLSIDRYDVRHLLPSPPPPRKPRRQYTEDPSLGSELDHERYLDLPPPGEDEQELDLHEGPKPVDTGGYRAVSFSYGKSNESIEENNNDADSGFRPPFQVPESLLQNLPPTEKLHQIIARTAVFVSKHGGQSEIVLRVKQGDNPTFGFLMPDHHLHAYFRFLVDHQELFEPDGGSKSLEEKNIANSGPDHSGGALSILGSIYGSGEDEEGTTKDVPDSEEAADVGNANVSNGSGQAEPYVNAAGKDEVVAKSSFSVMKEKAPIIKRNRFISTVGNTVGNKNEGDALNALSTAGNKSQTSLPRTSKVEGPIVEPPSDLKRVVDKIVEFILRNGKEFEAVLVEQDKKHGRFPFLLPSNQYHAYYLEVLKKVKESKLPGKASVSEKHDSVGHGVDKKTASKEGDTLSGGSASHDIPYNYDKKEKFKMVLGKSKKDGQDLPSKATEPQIDAAAAAAILQAATRGINNAGLEFFPRTSLNGSSRGPSIEGGRTSSFGSLQSSQPQKSTSQPGRMGDPNVSAPVAKAIAETAAIAAASEADSSEACLTKEQKLKAERLKRAKMFAAMIKTGAAPMKTEPLRGLSAEPPASGISGSGADFENLVGKEREGSSVPMDVDTSDKTEKSDKRSSVDEYNERRSKRSYRSRSKRNEQEEEEEKKETEEEYKRAHKHSRKKHRSQRSSRHDRDRHKHRKRHSSSEDTDSRHVHNYDDSLDDGHRRSSHRHKHDVPSEDERRPSKHHRKHASSSDNEHRLSRRRRKHHSSSSDDEHEHRSRSVRYRKSQPEEVDLEEGEILAKSDQSQASQGKGASREASVEVSKSYRDGSTAPSRTSETTEVPDDLRAKIRAMLMATL